MNYSRVSFVEIDSNFFIAGSVILMYQEGNLQGCGSAGNNFKVNHGVLQVLVTCTSIIYFIDEIRCVET
ncbi:MAG: hypothetical protein JW863_12090 [Chitinispirillaceae bacterium]|nr:hypothetical protein [Chitinispirillaceae bacterium]